MRLIDADQMAVDESEAYMSAQVQITHDLNWLVNFAAHSKIQRLIADTPTVDAAPVAHGRWDNVPNTYMSVISKDGAYHGNATTCSVCHEVNPNAYKTNFCPNCGAKMDIKDGGGNDAAD